MNSNWDTIWSNRRAPASSGLSLADLIRLDGFDTGVGLIEADDWLKYAEMIVDKLGIEDGSSVYDVGCGSGAFLLALSKCKAIDIGGLDYSQSLIEVARRVFPFAPLAAVPAAELSSTPRFDFVVANAVFQYLSLDYARDVLRRMLSKARRGVGILDVPNMLFREESESVRAAALSQKVYEEKYDGFQHTYFDPKWFIDLGEFSRIAGVEVAEQFVPNYAQAKFRFNVFIKLEQ